MNICSYICIVMERIHSEAYVTKVAKVLKVIAHPVRLQILAALRAKDALNVSELQDAIHIDVEQSMLSHHLIKMRDNGVLSRKKDGMYVYYSVVDPKLFNILDCMEKCEFI